MTFSKTLLSWYSSNKRQLPWRETKNPYFIWISEVILQQTRVAQGLSYYEKFIKLFPTPFALANASEENVLNAWQGLGYYSRARNLHFAAKQMVDEHQGNFPDTYIGVRSLKGVGEYTAAAVTSIAYEMPYAVVDGNVYRLLSRLFGISTPIDSSVGKKEFQILADKLLEVKRPGNYNQAVMEFGGQVCRPKNPDCENCIFQSDCVAFTSNSTLNYPVKSKKIKVTNLYFNYFLLQNGNNFFIRKREKKGIWQGLYELPLIETKNEVDEQALNLLSIEKFGVPFNVKSSFSKVHLLSHRKIHASFYITKVNIANIDNSYQIINGKDIANYPIPRLIEQFFFAEGIL